MMWDDRYRAEEYVYGTEPNAFLLENVQEIPSGDVLCIADGEGRNSVFLAKHGRRVSAIDLSEVGVAKARELARAGGVDINFVVGDLRTYDMRVERWGAIVSIFAHMPPKVRSAVHAHVVTALVPGGVFLLEAYRPDQLGRGTGGPSLPEMMMTVEELRGDFAALDLMLVREVDRDIREGRGHQGVGAVVQLLGRKPIVGIPSGDLVG
jgi:SAM-dependent methyltransferase